MKFLNNNEANLNYLNKLSSIYKTGLANGCFDLLHTGHLLPLKSAKLTSSVNKLIVGINSDESIKKLKGQNRPIIPENNRAFILSFIDFIDYVFIFDELDFSKYIKIIKPNVFIKTGYNMSEINPIEKDACNENKIKIYTYPRIDGFVSTSEIIDKIKKS